MIKSDPNSQVDSCWSRSALHAWEVPTFDLVVRSNEERALMLRRVGIQHYAYLRCADPFAIESDLTTSQEDVDAEIEAMKRHEISIRAWYMWVNTDHPAEDSLLQETLDAFSRHEITPRVWLPQSWGDPHPESDRGFPSSESGQKARVEKETARVAKVAALASQVGCGVDLYNHRGWYGVPENQLAILDELEKHGLPDVGMVYNFTHSRSPDHDDAQDFASIWAKIAPKVRTVNVFILGRREIAMIGEIRRSGWAGTVGVLPSFGGDAEKGLENALWGLEHVVQSFANPESSAEA